MGVFPKWVKQPTPSLPSCLAGLVKRSPLQGDNLIQHFSVPGCWLLMYLAAKIVPLQGGPSKQFCEAER